jgi:hypothetical protein
MTPMTPDGTNCGALTASTASTSPTDDKQSWSEWLSTYSPSPLQHHAGQAIETPPNTPGFGPDYTASLSASDAAALASAGSIGSSGGWAGYAPWGSTPAPSNYTLDMENPQHLAPSQPVTPYGMPALDPSACAPYFPDDAAALVAAYMQQPTSAHATQAAPTHYQFQLNMTPQDFQG